MENPLSESQSSFEDSRPEYLNIAKRLNFEARDIVLAMV